MLRRIRTKTAAINFALACAILASNTYANSFTTSPAYVDTPPDATLIQVESINEFGVATVTGNSRATLPNATLVLVNLQTGQYIVDEATAEGSFAAEIFAPPGTNIAVHQNTQGITHSYFHSLMAATLTRSPILDELQGGFATTISLGSQQQSTGFTEIQDVGQKSSTSLWISGSISNRTWEAGDTGSISGELALYTRNLSMMQINDIEVNGNLYLQRIFDEDGNQERPHPEAMSHVLTPSGLPIERRRSIDSVKIGNFTAKLSDADNARRASAGWSSDYELPDNLPQGIYILVLEATSNVPDFDDLYYEDIEATYFVNDRYFAGQGQTGWVSQIVVGEVATPRLSSVVGLNDFSQGSRGVTSAQDKGRFGIAGHLVTNSKEFILPMVDAKSGGKFTYNLEPFIPMISAGNKGTPSPPTVNFQFPSGQLAIEIIKPDGTKTDLGSAAFKSPFYQAVSSLTGSPLSRASNNPTQYFGLSTLDDRFKIGFDQYGLHSVELSGSIQDVFGNIYDIGGNYEIWVAKTLDLEEGVFPSTPFEVGDAFSPALVVQPGVPATIEVQVMHYPFSNKENVNVNTLAGKANSYGYFSSTEPTILFEEPGEYRVDYTASYVDEFGALWMGSSTWGSIVETPNSRIITHGSRGFDGGGSNSQWLFLGDDDEVGVHLEYPYQSGDVMWMEEIRNEPRNIADVPAATLQDLDGELTSLTQPRAEIHSSQSQFNSITWGFDYRINIGEIPLFSSSDSSLSPAWKSSDNNYWGYSYIGAARPGVRVREMISESAFENGYWRFDDAYNYQLGNGYNGDLTNDFKFQFVGSVFRAPSENYYYYGAYASLFVLLPDSEPVGGRVTPPFQGASGGPDGGALFALKGEAVDMFIHLTGIRAGSILEIGDLATFSGQIAPTLPGIVEISIISPSGVERLISGRANKVGYFYFSESDFTINETGVWRVEASVSYDGDTSSGPVEQPFPTGDILGSDNGRFRFYAVNKFTNIIPASMAREAEYSPGTQEINIDFQQPEGFTLTSLHQSTVMPGFLLEQSENSSLSYEYDAIALNQDFPNLDLSDDDGRTGVDTVTMSFLLSGIDSEGKTAHVARQLLLQGETLYALDPFYPLISESEVTVNHASLEAGDNLNIVLTLSKTKSDLADIYIAIQLPDESFVTLSREPFSISLINQVIPFVSGTSHSGEIVYPVINTTLPSDIASGNYKVFAIVTEAGANVLEPSNWASITEQSFLIN